MNAEAEETTELQLEEEDENWQREETDAEDSVMELCTEALETDCAEAEEVV